MKNNNENIIEVFLLFIIGLSMFIYIKIKNKDQIIERYYKHKSEHLYKLFKFSYFIIKLTLIFNAKFLLMLIIKKLYIF